MVRESRFIHVDFSQMRRLVGSLLEVFLWKTKCTTHGADRPARFELIDAEEDSMARNKKKCEHPACNCMVDEDDDYCSPYCSDASETTEISCSCGHAGCAIGAGREPMTARPS